MSNANLDDLVLDVNVSFAAPAVAQAGFGTILIAGRNATFSERVQAVTSLSAVTGLAGLTSSSPEYYAAREAFANGADRVLIGRMQARQAQVQTITIDTGANGTWTLTIGSTEIDYESTGGESAANIATGIRSAVNGASVDVTASGSSADVVLTADVAGEGFVASLAAPDGGASTSVDTTANRSVGDELAAITAENPAWYGLALASRVEDDILQAASYVEADGLRIFAAQTSDAGALASTTTDVLGQLEALAYDRTFGAYHAEDDEALDAAWLAKVLRFRPDDTSAPWYNQRLAGVAGDEITVTARDNVLDKNGNVYLGLKGLASTFEGKMASGRFIDETVTGDWFRSRVEEDIAQAFLDAAARGEKIPHDDRGYAVIEAIVRRRWNQGADARHFTRELDSNGGDALQLTFPSRAEVPASDIRNRVYSCSASALLAGGITRVILNISAIYDR